MAVRIYCAENQPAEPSRRDIRAEGIGQVAERWRPSRLPVSLLAYPRSGPLPTSFAMAADPSRVRLGGPAVRRGLAAPALATRHISLHTGCHVNSYVCMDRSASACVTATRLVIT